MTIHTGDNLDVLPTMDADSIDAIVKEPDDWHHRCDILACNCGRCHHCGEQMDAAGRRRDET